VIPNSVEEDLLLIETPGMGVKYCDHRVFLYVCLEAYFKTISPNFLAHVGGGRGLAIVTMLPVCTSGFVDDNVFTQWPTVPSTAFHCLEKSEMEICDGNIIA